MRAGLLELAAVVLCTIGLGRGAQECVTTDWTVEDKPCPEGLSEIWEERASRQHQRWCCDPDHPQYKAYVNLRNECRTTKCLAASPTSPCDGMRDRYVNGEKLEYDEILQESCTMEGGAQGVVGLCCLKNSMEGTLATTLGAEPNEFPHQAKLYIPGHCGGTIYNKNYILTAAHCVVDKDTKLLIPPSESWKVILGSNMGEMESKEYVYRVKNVKVHEDYSKRKPHPELKNKKKVRTYSDIVLLELDREIVFGPKVKALEIAPEGFDPMKYSDKAVIAGWGTTDTQEVSKHLQKGNFLIRRDGACFQDNRRTIGTYGHWFNQFDKMDQLLCLGGIMEGKFSPVVGAGDSGGPAICRGPDGNPLLCGLTSYGGEDDKCGMYKNETYCPPSVFTEVGFFNKWIRLNAGEQDPSTFYKPYLYGEPVPEGKYVHQVHITSQGGKPCGGTLVAPNFVVTAAQCVVTSDGTSRPGIQVVSGLNDLNGKGKSHSVDGVTVLPGFERVGPPVEDADQGNRIVMTDNLYKNDLAVLKLDSDADISKDQLPQLPETTQRSGKELAFPRNTTRGGQLMSRDFTFLTRAECQHRLSRAVPGGIDLKFDENQFCGVEKYSGGSTCDRELGGGVICEGNTLCGVDIFRLCELSIPNAFMEMTMHREWVKQAMKEL